MLEAGSFSTKRDWWNCNRATRDPRLWKSSSSRLGSSKFLRECIKGAIDYSDRLVFSSLRYYHRAAGRLSYDSHTRAQGYERGEKKKKRGSSSTGGRRRGRREGEKSCRVTAAELSRGCWFISRSSIDTRRAFPQFEFCPRDSRPLLLRPFPNLGEFFFQHSLNITPIENGTPPPSAFR